MAIAKATSHQPPATSKTDFGKIGVLMGGVSSEREISLRSGAAVYSALKSSGLDVEAVDITDDNLGNVRRQIEGYGIKTAFIALHGKFGEDGTVQGLLEEMNIAYTGSGVGSSRLALNKIRARNVFMRAGIVIPEAEIITPGAAINNKLRKFPLVVKPASSGSSIGLTIVDKKDDFAPALDEAFKYDSEALVEEYIKGRELTVGILDDKPLAVIEIVPARRFFDYQAKYTKGICDYVVPAKLPAKAYRDIQSAAIAAHRALACYGCSRVDIIIGADFKPFVLEVNTIPGMTEMSLLPKAASAEGISFARLCVTLLNLAQDK